MDKFNDEELNEIQAIENDRKARLDIVKQARLVIVLMCLTFCLGCSKPQDQIIPSDSNEWKASEGMKEAVTELGDDDKQLLKGWMMRSVLTNGIPEGKTIGQALKEQSVFVAEQEAKEAERKALIAKVAKKRTEAQAAMNLILTVALTKLEYHGDDLLRGIMEGFNMAVVLQNKSKKNLAGVKGVLVFSNMFGDEIRRVELSIDTAIPAGATITQNGQLDHNPFMERHKMLKSTPFEKLKTSFEPVVFILADGAKLEMPK